MAVCLRVTQVNAQPSLTIQPGAGKTIEISWPGAATDVLLEETASLGDSAAWVSVASPALLKNGRFSSVLTASGATRFFRLHTPPLISIRETSPVDGETDVAVTADGQLANLVRVAFK